MDQAKSHIPVPHYIHATQSSHAKRSTQPSIPAQVPPAKHRTMKNMLVSSHKKMQGFDCNVKDERQNEIKRLTSLVQDQQERISKYEDSFEKENFMKDEIRNLESKLQRAEEKLEMYEKHLMLSSIDPVTLETVEPSKETIDVLAEIRNQKKNDVTRMMSHINEMNSRTTKLIIDLKALGDQFDQIL